MSYWIFQAVPERYNLVEKLRERSDENWFVTRYFDDIKAGDNVYFWQAGKAAGLYGWGIVLSPQPYATESGDYRAKVSYQARFDPPILKQDIAQDSQLQMLQILRTPQGTNFRVKEAEAIAINQLIRGAGFDSPPDPA